MNVRQKVIRAYLRIIVATPMGLMNAFVLLGKLEMENSTKYAGQSSGKIF